MACNLKAAAMDAIVAAGSSKGGGTKAASQAFVQAFPNLGCFCASFSKQIFGRFVRFQEVASLKNHK
jgi:hypothetical protein